MIDLIQQRKREVESLCRRYGVRSLEVFGSAAVESFDPLRSDLDFLVDFLPLAPGQPFAFYFGLLEDLRSLFRRRVDLVVKGAIKDRAFQESVDRSRQVIYAA
ncbi:MAG: nucleotidyltransferase domain-containing protein [Gemmataceae bacterium]